jgi:hypothetical protein
MLSAPERSVKLIIMYKKSHGNDPEPELRMALSRSGIDNKAISLSVTDLDKFTSFSSVFSSTTGNAAKFTSPATPGAAAGSASSLGADSAGATTTNSVKGPAGRKLLPQPPQFTL